MYKPTVTQADLERLKEERDRADRLYNEALTALDQALTQPRSLPGPAALPDTSQLERLNRQWSVLPPDPVPFTGWRGRLGAFVWRMLGPSLQRQQEFNAALVEHANRSAESAAEAAVSVGTLSAAVGEELRALAHLQSRLIAYLQQVTLYVDTRDRFETGLLWHDLRLRTEGLAAGLDALGDELLKRREQVRTSDTRLDTRVAEIKHRITELDRMLRATRLEPENLSAHRAAATQTVPWPSVDEASIARGQLAGDGESATYAGFEDLYRGSAEDIRGRLQDYLPLFGTAEGEVVDLGCGRGEFLEALREQGLRGRGIDINPAMVARCRALGLNVEQGEGLTFLSSVPDASLGGILAAQVVEHLLPHDLVRLIDVAHGKLRTGGRLVLETVNPACWAAFFSSYIRDITHVRPIHPDTLRYLLVARGFENVEIRFSSPYPVEAKLRRLPLTLTSGGPVLTAVVQEFNHNVEILNGQMFTHLDYAAIGERR